MVTLKDYTSGEGKYVKLQMGDKGIVTFQTDDISTEESKAYLIYTKGDTTLVTPNIHRPFYDILDEEEIDYLCLEIPDFQYFFRVVNRNGVRAEISVPELENPETSRVPVPTADTFIYCIRLAMRLSRDEFSKFSDRLTGVIQNLLRKWRLEEMGYDGTIADDSFTKHVERVDEILQEEYDFYNPTRYPPKSTITLQTFGVFNAFNLHNTSKEVRDEVVSILPDEFEDLDAYRTGKEVRELLINLTNVEEGDKVLDPAGGVGSILREVAKDGATPHGVEVDSNVATTAVALNELNGININFLCADFVDLADELGVASNQTSIDETPLPLAFDSIIADLPFLSKKTSRTKSSVPEKILEQSLNFLANGGTATILAPTGLFYQKQSQELRNRLLNEYQIDFLLKVEEGELGVHRNNQVGILKITNENPPENHAIKVGNINTDEMSQGPQAVEKILQTDFEQTFDPERVKRRKKAQENLAEFTTSFIKLENIGEVRSGSRMSNSQLQENGIPFLRIRNVTQKEGFSDFVSEETVDVVAEPSNLLVSIKYSDPVTHVPESRVVPGSDWAIIRCETRKHAKVYSAYFQTSVGKSQLEAAQTEGVVTYTALSDLQSVAVPQYNEREISELAKELESISMDSDSYEEIVQEVMLE
jgi:type I restriction-modification system DNA methylase subunit